MGWEALVFKFVFMGIDYWARMLEREPERVAEANPLIERAKAMVAEERGPNSDDYAALDAFHADLDARIDKVIADDEEN